MAERRYQPTIDQDVADHGVRIDRQEKKVGPRPASGVRNMDQLDDGAVPYKNEAKAPKGGELWGFHHDPTIPTFKGYWEPMGGAPIVLDPITFSSDDAPFTQSVAPDGWDTTQPFILVAQFSLPDGRLPVVEKPGTVTLAAEITGTASVGTPNPITVTIDGDPHTLTFDGDSLALTFAGATMDIEVSKADLGLTYQHPTATIQVVPNAGIPTEGSPDTIDLTLAADGLAWWPFVNGGEPRVAWDCVLPLPEGADPDPYPDPFDVVIRCRILPIPAPKFTP